jgi:selenocysteine lyase/cysteine desulfurase
MFYINHHKDNCMFNRRQILKAATGLTMGILPAAAMAKSSLLGKSTSPSFSTLISASDTPQQVAKNESYWTEVSRYYNKVTDIINLEQGYWGKMAIPVERAYTQSIHDVNTQLSWYARKHYYHDLLNVKEVLAKALQVQTNEVALTRNATESFVNLITQYQGLSTDDAILWGDADYPTFQNMMQWLATDKHLERIKLDLPASGSKQDYIDIYAETFQRHPNIKLMLLTHVSNQHGLTLPVKEIAALAKSKGIDVICDCAQSWGLLNFTMDDLGVDWAIFNLHKWIGSPVGVGALYMRSGTLTKVAPFPGEALGDNSVQNRVHVATTDFAAYLTVPKALDFHFSLGAANKEERLRYLRRRWVQVAKTLPAIEVLGAQDDELATGMGGFRIKNKRSQEEVTELQQSLENEFGIFTVVRNGLSSGSCIRVTPQVFTTVQEIDTFSDALISLNKQNS